MLNPSNVKEPSSIDRFFWSKGSKMLGFGGMGLATGMLIAGSVQVALVIAFGITKYFVPGFPPIYPLFALMAVVFLGIAFTSHKKGKEATKTDVKLSSEARKMLYKIGQHIGWYDPAVNYGSASYRTSWWIQIFGMKTAAGVLENSAGIIMEEGCFVYNRLEGLLKLDVESGEKARTIAPQIRAAADESMVNLLNQVALLDRNPESQSLIESRAIDQIRKMTELANRFEELLRKPETLTDRLNNTTVMDNVLDQLRGESQAWRELNQEDTLGH
jgi:hypothetical protein